MMKFYLNKLLLLVFMLMSTAMLAQEVHTTISGTVKDDDGTALPGVSVTVVGSSFGTATNANGEFNLNVNQPPPFSITFSSIGYSSQTIKITQTQTTLNITLSSGVTELGGVIVHGNRTPENIMKSPTTIGLMDLRAIKESAAPDY